MCTPRKSLKRSGGCLPYCLGFVGGGGRQGIPCADGHQGMERSTRATVGVSTMGGAAQGQEQRRVKLLQGGRKWYPN